MPFHVDTLILKSFVAIAETGSFSRAAETVGRSQSAVSLQIQKLEENLNCALFERGKNIALTEQGEIFLGYARRMIELQWEAFSRLNEPEMKGTITLGTPEDFATHYLPAILASFAKQHPRVQLHVVCDLTLNLVKQFNQGHLDLILVKRDPERVKGGTKVWKEPLVWVASEHYESNAPIKLVLAPQPCIYRARALAALDRSRKSWEIVYTSPSLAGSIAAVRAGLGITILPARMVPAGLNVVTTSLKLPHLADSEIALLKKDNLSVAGKALFSHITSCLENHG